MGGLVELKRLECLGCGAPITDAGLDMGRGLARCSHCGAVFTAGGGPPAAQAVAVPPPTRALDVPMPKGIEVDDLGGRLVIRRRWWSPGVLFLLLFAVFWNGFMVFWIAGASVAGGGVAALFSVPFLLVGAGLAYVSICGIVNTTTLTVDRQTLTVRHAPMPWPGNKLLSSDRIGQLYCRSKVTHTRNNAPQVRYELHAVLADGGRTKVLGGLPEEDQVLWLEQELERFLKIQDVPVRGEHRS